MDINRKIIYILHSFNGRPYFEAVEYFAKNNGYYLEYRETNILRSIAKLLIGKKCVNCSLTSIYKNIKFFITVPVIKDCIIIYGTAPYDLRFLWYSQLRNKNNFIYHTSHPKWGEDEYSVFLYGLFTSLIKKVWIRILKNRNVKIVTVTEETKKTFERKFIDDKKIFQVYHSVGLDLFKSLKRDYGNRKLKILFVGRLVYEKGLDVLVEVINKMDSSKYEFTIVGDGDYKQKISYVFKKENVNYLGWISDKKEVARIFKENDILLNPSIRTRDWEELFGIVIIEAMASGLVVIATNHIGPKEIIKDGVNGFLVKEKNSKEIVSIIEKLNNNIDLLRNVSAKALKRANDFSIDNISKQWEGVFGE